MDATLQASAAVMKLWHTMKNDDNLRQLALGDPAKALESIGVELPLGTEIRYAVEGSEHHLRLAGLPNGTKTWVFTMEGGLRIEAGREGGSDELSVEELGAVAGGVTQEDYDRVMACCWEPFGGRWRAYCNTPGACIESHATCDSSYFGTITIPC